MRGRTSSNALFRTLHRSFFSAPDQGDEPRLPITEYPLHAGQRTKTGKRVCVRQSAGLACLGHPAIMPNFPDSSTRIKPCEYRPRERVTTWFLPTRIHEEPIKKATLREWRGDFAQYLRELGVPANATERAVRGQTRVSKTTGIFRAMERGDSTHYRERAESVARELSQGRLLAETGKSRLVETRKEVVRGWLGFASHLETAGQHEIARRIRRFVDRMPPAQTEKEWIAAELMRRLPREQTPSAPVQAR